jgi:S-methylmethionine-dependent homocysteine/selenocysteine methylase/SAM-dependent methyltransferase
VSSHSVITGAGGPGEMPAGPHARIMDLVASQRCVVLDGATGTELIEVLGDRPELEEHLWGLSAILDAPDDVRAVHRRYAAAGCDVVTTDTWGLPTALRDGAPRIWSSSRPVHWMDVARQGVRLAREAIAETGREGEVAVAFSLNGDLDAPDGEETIRLLARAWETDPPDLVLFETLSLVHDSTYATIEALLQTGLPVWLGFRRCRRGVCGIYGEHWGGPEGDAFGRAARRFEQQGVSALLINCMPPDHVPGMVSWLRDFTDLPLGVYPNLGYLSAHGWRSETAIGGAEYAQLALQWREEGAQIIGGCCGTGVAHIEAARAALAGTRPGTAHPPVPGELGDEERGDGLRFRDDRGRVLFPLDVPDLVVDPEVANPNPGSFLLWRHLYREGLGAHQRCLDVGSGTGLLAVQLARNGATHVHAVDIQPPAVANTLTNAFRNGVADRVTAEALDLYPWVPEERYDLIVASLDQRPADPAAQDTTHRQVDFWGRNLLDHLIGLLPEALDEDGVAYVVQLSIVGEQRTVQHLEHLGYGARVVDYAVVPLESMLDAGSSTEQIKHVEQHSDAYGIAVGDQDLIVVYLLEITRRIDVR